MRFYLFVSVLLSTQVLWAQSTFYQSLDWEADNTWGTQVLINEDNGYQVLGIGTCAFSACPLLYEINQFGEVENRASLFFDTEVGIRPISKGSYLKLDTTHLMALTSDINQTDVLLCAFDSSLQDTVWCEFFGGQYDDITNRLVKSNDGNFLSFYSSKLATSPAESISYLAKRDHQGNVMWSTLIGIEGEFNNAFNHLALPNGDHLTFYAACEPGVDCQGWFIGYGLYVTKVNSVGEQLWTQELRRGDFLRWHGTDPLLLDNGLVALNWIDNVVEVAPFDVRFQDMLIWMDQEGEIVQEYFFPRDRIRDIYSMTKAANGDIIGAGSINMADLELGSGGYVFRMSPEGELLWERYLADVRYPIDQHFFNDVIEAEDGGIVLTGLFRDSFPDGSLNPNVWLVKLDSMGCLEPGCGTFQVMGAVVSTDEVSAASRGELQLYPNPTASFAHLQWPENTELTYPLDIQVYDLTGRPLLSRRFATSPVVVQCADWPPGYYVVQVRDREGRQWVERLVVK